MSVASLRDSFQERLAIAEYDGQQTPLQAQRIAYLEAFTTVLTTLPHEDPQSTGGDWLENRIKIAKECLASENFYQLK